MRSEPRQRVVTGTDQTAGEWQTLTLGDCAVINAATYSPKEAWPLVNYLDTGNITENRISEVQHLVAGKHSIPSRARRKVQPGDIVYSTVRPDQRHFGLLKDPPANCLVSTAFAVLRGKAGRAHTDFLYWFLVQAPVVERLHTIAEHSVTAYPSIRPADIARLELRLPPLAEQRTIAHILGTLDAKIEVNRRMNATLDDIARALFTSWFVHFDPVRAKAALTQRASPGGSAWLVARAYLDRLEPALAALFPDRFVDSALGPIPAGWELSTIGQETQAVGGGTPSTKEPAYWHDARHYWATPKDLAKLTSPVLLNTARKISDAGLEKISSGLLPVGTVLLSSRAPIGYLAMTEVPTAINQGFIALICPGRLSHWYVLHWCAEHLEAIKAIAGGSTFAEISKQTFRPLPVLIPPRPLLLAFDTAVRPLYRRTVVNMQESAVLAALRDTLLPKLLSGRIRVRDAAAQTSDLQEKGEQGQGR